MFQYNFYIITVINKFECVWGMHAGGLHKKKLKKKANQKDN